MKYQRLVEIYVKPELRAKIKKLKQGLTYSQYLTQIFEQNNSAGANTTPAQGKNHQSKPKRGES